MVFARQLGAFGRAGDIAVGLSTSGNSANLLRAFDEASRRGMLTIGLAGYEGGKMAELSSIDYLFVAPSPRSTGSRKPRPRSTRCYGHSLPRRCRVCLGIPGEVVELHPEHSDLAKVNVSGVKRLINIALLADDPPKPGEWVLIHVGFALSKIDEAEAAAAMEFLEGIGQAYEDEIAALRGSLIE